ncbi:MAG: hypothetical protein ACXW3E_08795, partial [Thermoanaerobaculia bacterium]
MKRITALVTALLLATTVLVAQEKTPAATEEYNTGHEFRSKFFSVHNRDAREIAATVKLLGSGFKGAALS